MRSTLLAGSSWSLGGAVLAYARWPGSWSDISAIRRPETEFIAAVERLSGRDAVAFISNHHVGPDMEIELFMLKPELSEIADSRLAST